MESRGRAERTAGFQKGHRPPWALEEVVVPFSYEDIGGGRRGRDARASAVCG